MDAYFSNLAGESLLHISGPDTLKFLQGQTTCDTALVSEGQALLGAYCNPQGRMVCDFLLAQLSPEHFALRMRRDIIDSSAATLARYIVFSKAVLDAANSDWVVLACWGSDSRSALAGFLPALPEARLGAVAGEHFVIVQIDEAGEQFECFVNAAAQPALLESLRSALQESDESSWRALQIASGIARIEAPTVEEFIPQMLNFDLTGHVSFTKGCYTGQEVVARMHYRGKPKRRLYLAALPAAGTPAAGTPAAGTPAAGTPAAGTPLFTPDSAQSVGNIANSAVDAVGRGVALVVATSGGVENGLHVGDAAGPLLEIGALPCTMEKP